ncbi:HAD family hydrolase [Salaquimonas pukyongi]|uniref:HAD family hydrolase n=1 Tax=Salaquimonas pukyongi TaxID=2712698 RepID=UPI00096BB873|nr:HAD family hydrolase [Salaquimonas pukyongi]
MIRAVLFDKDGTLIDFERTYGPATAQVMLALAGNDAGLAARLAEPVGFNMETCSFNPASVIIAGTARDMAHSWAGMLGESDTETLTARIDALYLDYSRTSVVLFAETVPALSNLKERSLSLGIATNDSEAGARDHAEQAGIHHFFEFFAGHDSGHGYKPGPGMVLAFAEAMGFDPAEVAMVGDSLHDLEAARAAGAVRIGVASGLARAEELQPASDHLLEGIGALPALIAELNG